MDFLSVPDEGGEVFGPLDGELGRPALSDAQEA